MFSSYYVFEWSVLNHEKNEQTVRSFRKKWPDGTKFLPRVQKRTRRYDVFVQIFRKKLQQKSSFSDAFGSPFAPKKSSKSSQKPDKKCVRKSLSFLAGFWRHFLSFLIKIKAKISSQTCFLVALLRVNFLKVATPTNCPLPLFVVVSLQMGNMRYTLVFTV